MAIVEQGLTAQVMDHQGLVLLDLSGALTALEAPILFDAVDRVLEARPRNLQLGMAAVTLLDSGGIQALVRVSALAGDAAVPIQLLGPPWQIRRLIEVCGLGSVFTIIG